MSGIMLILREASYTPSNGGGTQGGNSQGGGTNNDQGQGQNPTIPGGGTQQPGTSYTNLLSAMNNDAYRTNNTKFSEVGGPTSGNGAVMLGMVPVSEFFPTGYISVKPTDVGKFIIAGYDSEKHFVKWLNNGGAFGWTTFAGTYPISDDVKWIRVCLNSDSAGNDSTGKELTYYAELISAAPAITD